MIKRRLIRILTVYSKTSYFSDRGTQRGLTYESFQLFEEDLNKKLKNKNVCVHVAIVPVANDDLIPALLEGRGDVAAGKLITEWRREQVYGIPPEQVVGSSTKAKFEPRDGKPVRVHGAGADLLLDASRLFREDTAAEAPLCFSLSSKEKRDGTVEGGRLHGFP